jgi:hypothetical protein
MAGNEKIYTGEVVEIRKETNSAIGCLRGLIVFFASIALACGVGIAVGMKTGGVGKGILAGVGTLIFGIIVASIMANTAKRITFVDCVLPLIISIISGIAFMPLMLFKLEIFSTFTCIGAGLFLTIGMFLYRAGKIGGMSLIIPSITFVYEIVPISLPTDIDNIIAFSGNAASLFISCLINKGKRTLLEDKKVQNYLEKFLKQKIEFHNEQDFGFRQGTYLHLSDEFEQN